MEFHEKMTAITNQQIQINDEFIKIRVVHSSKARGFRIRVGLNGVEILHPVGRMDEEMFSFIQSNADWILRQINRIEFLYKKRRPEHQSAGKILFHGNLTHVRAELDSLQSRGNSVKFNGDEIIIHYGPNSQTPLTKSFENWLRNQARIEINKHLDNVTSRLGCKPNKVYIMGQRTKWGNCSSRNNLSFNWRLILAPDFVLHYIVTHEVVHLIIPNHSTRFWLTVQSYCENVEQAKQWLRVNGKKLYVPLPSPLI